MWKWLRKYFMPEYVSEIDQFLESYDVAHPDLSASQRRERDKYRHIYRLRDSSEGSPHASASAVAKQG